MFLIFEESHVMCYRYTFSDMRGLDSASCLHFLVLPRHLLRAVHRLVHRYTDLKIRFECVFSEAAKKTRVTEKDVEVTRALS